MKQRLRAKIPSLRRHTHTESVVADFRESKVTLPSMDPIDNLYQIWITKCNDMQVANLDDFNDAKKVGSNSIDLKIITVGREPIEIKIYEVIPDEFRTF